MKDITLIVSICAITLSTITLTLSWLLLGKIIKICDWWDEVCRRMDMECVKRNW